MRRTGARRLEVGQEQDAPGSAADAMTCQQLLALPRERGQRAARDKVPAGTLKGDHWSRLLGVRRSSTSSGAQARVELCKARCMLEPWQLGRHVAADALRSLAAGLVMGMRLGVIVL